MSIVDAFKINLKQSSRKPNKILVDKGIEFHNNSFKNWLKDNDIEMYSTHNEDKSVLVERFIRTLKAKIYKYMTRISKNVYIDKLDDIVNKYNNTYHATIKMKPMVVKDNTYIDFKKGSYVLLAISMVKKLLEHFVKKNYKKLINKNLSNMSNGKVIIVHLTAGLIKKT